MFLGSPRAPWCSRAGHRARECTAWHASGFSMQPTLAAEAGRPAQTPATALHADGSRLPWGRSSGSRRPLQHPLRAAPPLAPPPTTPLPWDLGSSYTQGLRDGMEDDLSMQYDAAMQHLYCGIFDGHGGSAAALWLSKELHRMVLRDVAAVAAGSATASSNGSDDGLKAALVSAFTEADKALMQYLKTQGDEVLHNAGSTATVVLASPERIIAANIGDTQAFLMRKNQPFPLTTPHRVYGSGKEVQSETKRIQSTGAWIHDGRVCNILAVSRAFGDWEFKGEGLKQLISAGVERGYWPKTFADKQRIMSDPIIVTPDVSHTKLTPDDEFLVVATDGLWDVMAPSDAMRWAKNKLKLGKSAQEVAEGLVQVALTRYSSDNISCIVVDFKGTEHYQSQRGAGGLFGGMFSKR